MRKLGVLLFSLILLVGFTIAFQRLGKETSQSSLLQNMEEPLAQTTVENEVKEQPDVSVVASHLEVPWAIAFLPDGRMLFTERRGRVFVLEQRENVLPVLVAEIQDTKQIGEGGLLGIAVHPQFEKNSFVYVYFTYSGNGNNTLNRVSKFQYTNGNFTQEQVIVDAIPGNANHNGGRLKFGPDGYLYITTGDAQNPSLAQDIHSVAGKILRVTDEGNMAPGNPFGNLVYSYGHRNPQGLAWDSRGRLWETEHGPSAHDEINLIEAGANYGWPTVTGDEGRDGLQKPVSQSGSTTWAPSGMAISGESLFFAGLRGSALYAVSPLSGQIAVKELWKNEYGRIREVVIGPDGFLYLTTSNRDGRGAPKEDDDRILKINPQRISL